MRPSTGNGRRPAALLLALAVSACTQKASGSGPDLLPPDPQGVVVTVSPATRTLYSGQGFTFTARVTGTTNHAVDWSIQEGPRGGSIVDGAYLATTGTGTFHVLATSRASDTAVGSAEVAVQSPPDGGIPMTAAHRTSGVAPLAVFFDAVDDVTSSGSSMTFAWTSGVTQPADKEGAHYAWDFGDPGSGTWGTTGLPRNTATGFTAAHVFESPGSYVVRLTVTDTGGATTVYSQTITVSNPETVFASTTRYVAAPANGGADGNPGTLAQPYATLARAMTDVASGAAKRVLLRRGDTFTAATTYAITAAGPGIIGAYGTGNRPILNVTYQGQENVFSPRDAGADWRIMDLELRGPGTGYPTGPVGPPNAAGARNLLALRLLMTSGTWQVSLGWGDWWPGNPAGYQVSDAIFVVECEAPTPGDYGFYVGARRLALLGNSATDSQRTHVARAWLAHKAVFSNNLFLRCHAQRHELKIHGAPADGRPPTRWITITDNRFDASDASQWSLAVGPQDDASNEDISHVLIERNHFSSGASSASSIEVNSSYTMIRNNQFDFTGSPAYGAAALIWRRGIEPVPTRIRAFNNTCYKTTSTSDTLMFDVRAPVINAEVRNNLGVAWQTTTGWRTVQNSTTTGWGESNNALVVDSQVTLATTTTAPGGVVVLLQAGSSAVNGGTTLPEVREDFQRQPRSAAVSGLHDIGSDER